MHHHTTLFVVTMVFGTVGSVCSAQTPHELKTFPRGLVLIGAQMSDEPDACLIVVISPTGESIRTLFRREDGFILPEGRLSRQGDRLAFCFLPNDGTGELIVIDGQGEAIKIMDGEQAITAWSPDGQQIACYRNDPKSKTFESFVFDLGTRKRKKLELEADYVAEDWHPFDSIRTAIYMNPRNRMYREKKGDSYPARQLDLLIAAGKMTPITKNPCTDNIWSRFSPKGDRLAHYGRRLVGEKSLEYAVVCGADGSQPKQVFSFTEFGDRAGLKWFRPNGPPAWSPDGQSLVWSVSTNVEPTSVGEQRELLFIARDGRNPRRLPLTEIGLQQVSAIEWR